MKTRILTLFYILLFFVADGICGDSPYNSDDNEVQWPTLKATLFSYDNLPTTQDDAIAQNWTASSSTPNDCTNGGHFNGVRMVEAHNVAIGLLYDWYGVIAGIQILVLRTIFRPPNPYRFDLQPSIQPTVINGVKYYMITAYFIDPSKICERSDYPRYVDKDGVGNALYYQNGSTPAHLVQVPIDRDEAIAQGWSAANCFDKMGFHNFWHIEDFANTDCTNFFPALLLYDSDYYGKLMGAGFWIMGRSEHTSSRLEEPPPAVIKEIMGEDTPACILDRPTTTLHFSFRKNPTSFECPKSKVM